jgi:NAD(P)H-hydrate epimerase
MDHSTILTCQQVRELDRAAIEELGMPGLVLMENAGRGLVDLMARHGIAGPVLIACGPGNNGGDGLVMARHLDLMGIEVHVLLAAPPAALRGDAADNLRWLRASSVAWHSPDEDWTARWSAPGHHLDWVVDALLGTGARGAPRGGLADIIQQLNDIPAARRLAVDIPSGLDGDTGQAAATTFRADITGTFVAVKPGLIAPPAASYVGRIEVVSIGVPRGLLQRPSRAGD